MSGDREAVEAAIAALEAQRAALGDAVVDLAVSTLQAQLSGSEDVGAQLRTVAILFVDVVGSTSLSSTMDAEDIHELMDGLAARLTAIVEGHLGRVLKYTGDGLLAAFGLGEEPEHAAAQAVRAGLAMTGDLAAVQVRVGVHVGRVLVGGGVEGDANIRGQAVNLAARMEQSAPHGGLRISADTYLLVRGLFEVTQDEPIVVKGIAEPLRTYLVRGVRTDVVQADRGIAGLDVAMVGRAAELSELQRAVEAIEVAGGLHRLCVVGEAGVGKSRLLAELRVWLDERPRDADVVIGRAQLETRREPFALLRSVLVDAAGDRQLDGLHRWLDADEVRHLGALVGQAMDTANPDADPDRILTLGRRAAGALVTRQAQAPGVLVVLLEDLHWADEETLDLLDHLRRTEQGLRMVVIATGRPELLDRRDDLGDIIRLEALGADDAAALVAQLLSGLDVIPAGLCELIATSSGGVPFFIEEIVRSLLDDGTIVVEGPNRWTIDPSISVDTIGVPATLLGVLQSRFDSLSPAERSTAQRAAVIGHVFWPDAVAALGGDVEVLSSLEDRGVVVTETGTGRPGHTELRFRHHLLHQFVADTILKADRRESHRLAAAWLRSESALHGRVEHLVAIASHHEAAGDRDEAVRAYEGAAAVARSQGAPRAVIDLLTRALVLAGPDDAETLFRLVRGRAAALAMGDERDLLMADIDQLDVLAELLDADVARAQALQMRVRALVDGADHGLGLTDAYRFLEVARRCADVDLIATALSDVASCLWRMGDLDGAARYRRELFAVAEQGASPTVRARTLRSEAMDDRFTDRPTAETEAMLSEALALSRSVGDGEGEVTTLNSLGIMANNTGDPATGLARFEETARRSREIGWSYGEALGNLNVANLLCERGDAAEACAVARQAADVAVVARNRDLEAAALLTLAWAAVDLDDLDIAAAAFERARTLFLMNDSPHYALDGAAGLAFVASRRGDSSVAVGWAIQVVEYPGLLDVLDELDWGYQSLYAAHTVLLANGDGRATGLAAQAAQLVHTQLAVIPTDEGRRERLATNMSLRNILDITSSDLST